MYLHPGQVLIDDRRDILQRPTREQAFRVQFLKSSRRNCQSASGTSVPRSDGSFETRQVGRVYRFRLTEGLAGGRYSDRFRPQSIRYNRRVISPVRLDRARGISLIFPPQWPHQARFRANPGLSINRRLIGYSRPPYRDLADRILLRR